MRKKKPCLTSSYNYGLRNFLYSYFIVLVCAGLAIHCFNINSLKKALKYFKSLQLWIFVNTFYFFCRMMNEALTDKGSSETKPAFPFKGVIFDMDGTLIESTEADYLAWKRLFAEHNQELSFEEYFPLIGMKSAVVVQTRLLLDGEIAKEALAKKMDYFSEIVSGSGIKTVPHATILLQQLKEHNVKLALATSSRQLKVKMVLQLTELLSYFGEVVTGDEVSNSKPAPDIFLKAAEKLQLSPHECVVIEDAASGVKAAKNAGMKCVAITTTHTADLLQEADLVIDSFEELDFEKLAEMLKSN